MDEFRKALEEELNDKEGREQIAEDLLSSYIALQIKTIRQQRNMTQQQLAEASGKKQSQISAMEQVGQNSWKVSTLQKLAKAFDLALVVRFETFDRFLDETLKMNRASLQRLSYEEQQEALRKSSVVAEPEASTSASQFFDARHWTSSSSIFQRARLPATFQTILVDDREVASG